VNDQFNILIPMQILSLLFSTNLTFAEALKIENIVVTGSNIPLYDEKEPPYVEILGPADIENKMDGNFIDLLRGTPGLDVAQVGGDGGITFLSLRGGDPNFTSILIDGVKVNNPTNSRGGAFDFSSLDPNMIDRIEILRGPASPVLGSGSVSGVINLITRKNRDQEYFSANASYGSDNSFALSSSYSAPIGEDKDVTIGLSYSEGGDSPEGNKLDRLNVSFGAGGDITENFNVRMNLFYSDSNAQNFPEDSGGPRLAVFRDVQTRNGDIFSGHIKSVFSLNDKFQFNLLYNMTRIDETVFSPAIAPGVFSGVPSFTTISNFSRNEIIFNGLYHLSDTVKITVGAAYLNENGGDAGFVDFGFQIPTDFSLTRNTASVFAEARISELKGCELSLSSRLDEPNTTLHELNFKAGVNCALAEDGPALFATWGEGFKLPSFFALGNPLVGNPDLLPEKSSNFEVGLQQMFFDKKMSLKIIYYNNRFSNLIDFDPEIFQNINRNRVNTEGVEFSSKLSFANRININMNVSYTDTNIVNSDIKLRHRPKWKGNAGITLKPKDNLKLNFFANIKGNFIDSSIVTGNIAMPGYTTVDFSAIQKIGSNIKIKLSMKNLLNENFEEILGFPAAGRVMKLNMKYIF